MNFTLSLQEYLALFGVILSGCIFFLYARFYVQAENTIDGFFLANNSVSIKELSNTFSAATVSLASSIIFFICAHREYGYLMGVGPLFLCLVQFLLLRFASRVSLNFKQVRSIADIWSHAFSGKIIPRTIALLCAFSCLLGMFAELLVGSEIFSTFLPDTSFYKALCFFLLGLTTLGYVRFGGYRAIIKTDTWQLFLLFLATIAMILFSIQSPILDNSTLEVVFSKLFSYNASGWSLFIFLFWVCLLNVFYSVMDLAQWQRMAALKSDASASIKFLLSLWKWGVVFLLPMMCFVLLYAKGNQYDTMSEFLNIVKTQGGSLGVIWFPLIVIGFAAALFSTADTLMIAAMYALFDKHILLGKFERSNSTEREKLIKQYITGFSIILFFLLSVLYYIQHSKLSELIIPIMYAVWGQMSVVAPLIIYALYRMYYNRSFIYLTKTQINIILSSLITGWIIILAGSMTTEHLYEQWAFIISSTIVSIGLFTSINWPVPQQKVQEHSLAK